jgi:hypothetical protein
MDLERGLRLLSLRWAADGLTSDGHAPEEWRLSLAGVLWRVGQVYRELARRKGEAEARETIRLRSGGDGWAAPKDAPRGSASREARLRGLGQTWLLWGWGACAGTGARATNGSDDGRSRRPSSRKRLWPKAGLAA